MDKISVVTICFNNLADLLSTLQSVDAQTQKPFEHIIINGSDSDEIKNYFAATPQPTYRIIISEKDKGISDAMNKGIQKSTGEIIHLLHAGDVYASADVLGFVSGVFAEEKNISWIHGRYLQTRGGEKVESGKPFDKKKLYRGMRQVAHPSMFVAKHMYDKHGMFSLEKKIAMDYDFLIRLRDESFFFTEKTLVNFAADGISNQQISAGLKEVQQSYEKVFGFSALQWFWFVRIRLLNVIISSAVGRWLYSLAR